MTIHLKRQQALAMFVTACEGTKDARGHRLGWLESLLDVVSASGVVGDIDGWQALAKSRELCRLLREALGRAKEVL